MDIDRVPGTGRGSAALKTGTSTLLQGPPAPSSSSARATTLMSPTPSSDPATISGIVSDALFIIFSIPHLYYGAPAPSAISCWPASQRPSGLVWSGVDDIVRGTETPPSWAISHSEDRDQVDRDCVHGRDLIARTDTLRECFNNVDVGAPLWQSEPRHKSSCREFAFSHPSL